MVIRSSLEDAMKAADGVRQVCNEKHIEEEATSKSKSKETSSWDDNTGNEDRKYYPDKQFPPGAVEGFATFVLSGLIVFAPFRSAILRSRAVAGPMTTTTTTTKGNGQRNTTGFKNLVDLVITPVLAVASAQVGLAAASLVGSKVYLEEVANVPPTTNSPMTDLICSDLLLIPKEKGIAMMKESSSSSSSDSSSSWDPRVQTLFSLSRAMDTCQRRSQYQGQKY
mmetsp:Transcript_38632/g.93610  ORF Transcript_38632/g.93610 Transcript_38632/m.93610 type:complete len:224 (-) Transcript_38632:24-695(-)